MWCIVLLVLTTLTDCRKIPARHIISNAKNRPHIINNVGNRQNFIRNAGNGANFIQNAVKPYLPESTTRYMRYGQQQVDKLPNISLSISGGSFAMKFKGLPVQTLIIKRAPNATIGSPWPLPQNYVVNNSAVYKIMKNNFKINIRNNSCDVLDKAIQRFKENIFKFSLEEFYSNLVHIEASGFLSLNKKYGQDMYTKALNISTLHIYVNSKCSKYPSLQSDESYHLLVKKFGMVLMSSEVWGALRGLETLSQLIFSWKGQLYVRDTIIKDFPRFKHRGVLLDSARHFMTKSVIFDVLEGMYQNKMNVLHWHLVDDQSFSYQSKVFPDLSGKGAFHPSLAYTHEDIADIIEFARLRGIRVIPEIDTPGHTYSWGFGYPHVLTQCYDSYLKAIPGYYGPLNPARNYTYDFLKILFTEVMKVFPDKFVHLGGDEVPKECWTSNPEVTNLLKRIETRKFHSYSDMAIVWEYYTNRLLNILKSIKKSKGDKGEYILWEEASKNNFNLSNDTIIQIWMGGEREIQKAIDQGYRVLFSSCWYLDHSKYGVHWPDYYTCDPARFTYTQTRYEQKILGGEVCLWSEFITSETAMTVLWPRASAAAERLWSSASTRNINEAGRRLQEHRCRMLRRGLQVGHINGPDYCLLPDHREDVYQNSRRKHISKRSISQEDEIRYSNLIFKRINNIEPLVVGLAFSTTGAVFILLLMCLKFKSRVFVICWTFR